MNHCQHCHAPIPAGSPDGVCPACLIQLGQPQAGTDSGFAPPTVAEIQGRIPGIELTELIGHGGMGAVYVGHQFDLDRQVAVKILPQALSHDPAFVQRFRREAQTLAKLDHENECVTVRLTGIHVAYGYHPRTGKKLVAKGLIAIGDIAVGGCALGGASVGIVSIGGLAIGLNALGGCAIGLQMALGGAAVGGFAMGGAAIGLIAFGGAAVGLLAYGGGVAGHIVGGAAAAGKYEFVDSPITDWVIDPMMPTLFTGAISLATIGPLAFVLALVAYAILRARTAGQVERVMPPEVRRSATGSVVTMIVLSFMFPIQAYTAAKLVHTLTKAEIEVIRAEMEMNQRQLQPSPDELESNP